MNKVFAQTIAFDAACALLFVVWQIHGIQGAGNLLLFVTWGFSLIAIGVCLTPPKKPEGKRTPAHAAWATATDVIFISAFAWIGHITTAGIYLLAVLSAHGYRCASYKLNEEGGE